MGKLPDRWLDYRPLGKRVEGARFIAFKTPLKETFATRLTVAERFTPEDLVKACPELGLVVDLTNTTKYYTKEEFLRRGVEYEKVNCPGQVIPPLDSVMRFFKVVDNFLFRHKNDDTLIGVHCTHGVNRTGYMICRYLIQKMGMPLSKAVVCVEKARGHKIERGNFIDHLKRFTSPIPVSTYSPEGEINKRPEMPIGGRKGAGRPHGGDSGRASPRPRGSDHFPDTRRLRTRSRTPPRAPAKKYQDAHHRDKIKFGERSGDILFDSSDRPGPFGHQERYGRHFGDPVGFNDPGGADIVGNRPTDSWGGPDPSFSRFEGGPQIRFGPKDFDDRKHYIDRMKGSRHYSPAPLAGRPDFKERYPPRQSAWMDTDGFPPDFNKSSFSRPEPGIPYRNMPYSDSFSTDKSGHPKHRKDVFQDDHPPFMESNSWKHDHRVELGGFDKIGHGRRSPYSRDIYSGKGDKGWGHSVLGDGGSRHFDGKHDRSEKPPGLLKHSSPPRRSDRSPTGNDKGFRDKRIRVGRENDKDLRRSRSPFSKRPLFLIEDRKGPTKGDHGFRKRSVSAETLRRFESDSRDYPSRFPPDEKGFASHSRLESRTSPPLNSRGGYRESNDYFRKEEERRTRGSPIGDVHKPFFDGPRRSTDRDLRYRGDKPRKDDVRQLQDPAKYHRKRSGSPHRPRYYNRDRLSPIWLKEWPRGRHGSPKGGHMFGGPDFYPDDERNVSKYRESPGRKPLRLQEHDLHSGRINDERRVKKVGNSGPRPDSPRPESPHHPKGRKRYSPNMTHYDRVRDRFSPRNETIVVDKIHFEPAYQNQDVDCRNILNQKRFYRPDSANPCKTVFNPRDDLRPTEKRARSVELNLGPTPIDRREGSFERDSGRFRFVSREGPVRGESHAFQNDNYFVSNNDLRKTLQRDVREDNLVVRHEPPPPEGRSSFVRGQGRYGPKSRNRFDFSVDDVNKNPGRRVRKNSREKTPEKPVLSLRLGPPTKKPRREPVKPKLFPKEPIKSGAWRKKNLSTTSQKRR